MTSLKGTADHFNKFFMNVGVTLASKFSTNTSKINSPVSEKLFTFSKTDAKCVEDHIKHYGKATGLDGTDTRILKAGASILSIYFENTFNYSLATSHLLKCWKMKKVSPVHEGHVETDASNFRPISIYRVLF